MGAPNSEEREVARLTLNPILLHLSYRMIDWNGGEAEKQRPAELVAAARARFPDLPLSWAVEGAIALLLVDGLDALDGHAVEAYCEMPEQVRRFRALPPAEKIRVGQRWARSLAALRAAR